MSYYFSKIIETDFDTAIDVATEALKEEGFGVLTTIDVQEKFKEKLDIDFHRYTILGACSPAHAYKAILHENKIGTMLPCNVIVQDLGKGRTEISAVNPIESMSAIENEHLGEVAMDVKERLQRFIENLKV
jgi:uncharacterized protein (DUF302 family)